MKLSELDMRDAFINELYVRAKSDKNIIFLSGEYGAPSLDKFREDLPGQFINAAISEQNMISVAAGLALNGKRVYVYSIASFITLRCYEQIKIDLCCMKLPVTIIGVGTCYAYSVDGPTHHATEDIAIMRALANMQIYSPSDSNMTAALVDVSLRTLTSIYVRLDKGKYPLLYGQNCDVLPGYNVIGEGEDLCIIATGTMVHRATEIADELKKHSVQTRIIDMYRLKPIDAESILRALGKSKRVITIEEHTINGGLGSIVADIMTDKSLMIPLKKIAIQDNLLYAYGNRERLHRERRLDSDSVVKIITEWL
jgi:transketolase